MKRLIYILILLCCILIPVSSVHAANKNTQKTKQTDNSKTKDKNKKPALPKDVKITETTVTASSISFSWKKVADIDGYYLYLYDKNQKKYVVVSSIDKEATSYTLNNLNPGTKYTYVMRAFKRDGKNVLQSKNYGYVKKRTCPMVVADFHVEQAATHFLTLEWNQTPGATGYMIFQYDNKKEQFHKIKTVKSAQATSFKVKELAAKTEYTFAIKAYCMDDKEYLYSDAASRVKVSTTADYSKKTLYVDGDSIALGLGAKGYSFGDALSDAYGFKLTKNAVSGATLADSCEDSAHIVDSILKNVNQFYDYVIIDGGVNDYFRSIEIGEISHHNKFDSGTTAGALETIFSFFQKKYPKTKVYFLIPHKIYDSGRPKRNVADDGETENFNDITIIPNLIGYTYLDYYNTICQTCEKYKIPMIDLYTNCDIDCSKQEDRDAYTANGDGIHPIKETHLNIYAPEIAKVMNLK